jgi:hypothetical protein
MLLSQVHEFHFIITRSMKKCLKNLDIFTSSTLEQCSNLSGIIVKVLSEFAPILKREHKWGKQRMSQYMCVIIRMRYVSMYMHI